MSYDPNGHNSHQDILEEIERLKRVSTTKTQKKRTREAPRESERGYRDGKRQRGPERED